jgi:hypothetical protein
MLQSYVPICITTLGSWLSNKQQFNSMMKISINKEIKVIGSCPLLSAERIKMPKRGGELGFSKNLSNL